MEVSALFGLLRRAWPYLLAAGIGFSAAWWIQGVNVGHAENAKTKAENELAEYKAEQVRLAAEKVIADDKRRGETEQDWRKKYADLQSDHEIYKRCVASGKCGRMCNAVPGSAAGLKLPATIGIDGTGANAVPTAGGAAEETVDDTPQVLRDCAATTLQLNKLQEDIEKQDGYRQ